MYGSTNSPQFRGLEGHEDDGVEVLFFWDRGKRLLATAVNVSCPAQEVEGLSSVNADFWHEVREALRKKHGKDLCVLAWTGAAGDQSPHLMYRKPAEERMRQLRGLTRLEEIARRIVRAWEEAYEGASKDVRKDVPLIHKVQMIELPRRKVTEQEYREAKAAAALVKAPELQVRNSGIRRSSSATSSSSAARCRPTGWSCTCCAWATWRSPPTTSSCSPTTACRCGCAAGRCRRFCCSCPARAPTCRRNCAVRGGGYSAVVQSGVVGPEGGQELVERTVGLINSLWPDR